MPAVVEKFLLGTQTTLIDTGLNSMANNALVLGSAFNNTIGQTGDGYTLCDVELYFPSMGGTPTANTGFTLWMLGTQDGTNYEDGDASVTPAKLPSCVFPIRAVATAQRIIRRVSLAWGLWKPLLKNDGTGQSLAATLNTLKIRPVTRESV